MAIDFKALSLSKKFTEETSDGLGAVKGANCTIKSINKVDGTSTVTFEWTGTSGAKQTNTMEVKDGTNGVDGAKGDTGAQGPKGEKGDKGDKGERGNSTLELQVVTELPLVGDSTIIYLKAKDIAGENNIYDEFVYTNGAWEKIGDTEIDLSNYVPTEVLTQAEYDALSTYENKLYIIKED